MHVLVTWGSKRGGTEGIARAIGDELERAGVEDVELCPADQAGRPVGFDAVIVGGALYANRWHHAARHFVNRHRSTLQRLPVWFFSSGPLDESANQRELGPTRMVQILMDRVGAQGHVTFGGRLTPDARGFPASLIAKRYAGDFRDFERVRRWAREIAEQLPRAHRGTALEPPGHSPARLGAHAAAGWALSAVVLVLLLWLNARTLAFALYAAATPIVFALVARHYFRARGARESLPTAAAFTAIVAGLDLVVVAGLIEQSLSLLTSILGLWLPLALIFAVTWAVGELSSMGPLPSSSQHKRA